MTNNYYIYILASQRNGTIYIGIASDLIKRVWEHKNKSVKGFTSKYNVNKWVYYEEYQDVDIAIAREKRLKEWTRKWKLQLIEKNNPYWNDLFDEIVV